MAGGAQDRPTQDRPPRDRPAQSGSEQDKPTQNRPAQNTPAQSGSVRVDTWIWCVRLTRTRSMAGSACRAGHVKVNGERAKPAQPVRAGDEVRLVQAGRERVVVVSKLLSKRVGAPLAAECFVDNSPPPPRADALAMGVRDRGAGRPTKRDRRELERLHGATRRPTR